MAQYSRAYDDNVKARVVISTREEDGREFYSLEVYVPAIDEWIRIHSDSSDTLTFKYIVKGG